MQAANAMGAIINNALQHEVGRTDLRLRRRECGAIASLRQRRQNARGIFLYGERVNNMRCHFDAYLSFAAALIILPAAAHANPEHSICMSTFDGIKSQTPGHCTKGKRENSVDIYTCHFPTPPLSETCYKSAGCYICQGED